MTCTMGQIRSVYKPETTGCGTILRPTSIGQIRTTPYLSWYLMRDDDLSQNHILCLFHGPMVQNGVYGTNGHHHYDLLRTLVDMYDLPDIGASAGAEPIDEIWQQATSTSFNSTPGSNFVLWPNPGMTTQGFEISSASGFRRGDVLIVRDGLSRELYRQTLDTDSKRLQVSSDALALQTGLFSWSCGQAEVGYLLRSWSDTRPSLLNKALQIPLIILLGNSYGGSPRFGCFQF